MMRNLPWSAWLLALSACTSPASNPTMEPDAEVPGAPVVRVVETTKPGESAVEAILTRGGGLVKVAGGATLDFPAGALKDAETLIQVTQTPALPRRLPTEPSADDLEGFEVGLVDESTPTPADAEAQLMSVPDFVGVESLPPYDDSTVTFLGPQRLPDLPPAPQPVVEPVTPTLVLEPHGTTFSTPVTVTMPVTLSKDAPKAVQAALSALMADTQALDLQAEVTLLPGAPPAGTPVPADSELSLGVDPTSAGDDGLEDPAEASVVIDVDAEASDPLDAFVVLRLSDEDDETWEELTIAPTLNENGEFVFPVRSFSKYTVAFRAELEAKQAAARKQAQARAAADMAARKKLQQDLAWAYQQQMIKTKALAAKAATEQAAAVLAQKKKVDAARAQAQAALDTKSMEEAAEEKAMAEAAAATLAADKKAAEAEAERARLAAQAAARRAQVEAEREKAALQQKAAAEAAVKRAKALQESFAQMQAIALNKAVEQARFVGSVKLNEKLGYVAKVSLSAACGGRDPRYDAEGQKPDEAFFSTVCSKRGTCTAKWDQARGRYVPSCACQESEQLTHFFVNGVATTRTERGIVMGAACEGELDWCAADGDKIRPGRCGCGAAETDGDADGLADCADACPADELKQAAGICGCGESDVDTDQDGTADCNDACASDSNKVAAGICGCGVSDVDTDQDGTADCNDACASDSNKVAAGICGCGESDVDTDQDGTADCNDACASDSNKVAAGICGCGVSDVDTDQDGTADCNDACPSDPNTTSGPCTGYNFTPCGQIGRSGPSQGACDSSYAASALSGAVTVDSGYQRWTVPATGTYRITAAGAQGGSMPPDQGGNGATVSGEFDLTAGEELIMVVGQAGYDKTVCSDWGAGGGGASYVTVSGGSDVIVPLAVSVSPLIIGAGGGGGGDDNWGCAGQDTSRLPGHAATLGAGGSGTIGTDSAGAGAGYLGDGASNDPNRMIAAQSFLNGAVGGYADDPAAKYAGFGGGAAPYNAGGSGGGYTGGSSAYVDATTSPAGGGYSYNVGQNPQGADGDNPGDGWVLVELLSAAPPAPTLPPGLVHCWAADGDGSDSAGNTDVVVNPDVSFGAGVDGQAFQCSASTGSASNGVYASAAPSVSSAGPWTIDFWLKRDTSTSDAWLIDREYAGGTGSPLLSLHSDTSGFAYWYLRGDTGTNFTSGGFVLPSGQWQHLAITRDAGAFTIYLNGTQVYSRFDNMGSLTLDPPRLCGHPDDVSARMTGSFDTVRIWNRGLSPSEIAASAAGNGTCAVH